MNGNRNGLRERRQGDFEMAELRGDVDRLTATVNALQVQLQAMIIDYNNGVGLLKWFKWLAVVGGSVAGGFAAWKGIK